MTRYAHTFVRGDHAELADVVLAALGPDPMTYDAGKFWRYEPERGIWTEVPEALVRHTAARFAGCPVLGAEGDTHQLKISAAMCGGAEQIARDRLASDPARLSFAAAPPGVAFANGFARVTEGRIELLPHAPEHLARFCYPFPYDAEAPLVELHAFWEACFRDCSEDERGARVALIQEFTGAALLGDATRYQRCLVLFGPGSNGKSEALKLLRALFPPEAVTSLSPHRWGDRFSLADLEGRAANFVDEFPEAEVLNSEIFKSVVTGQVPVTGERKHQDPFQFTPRAAHFFSTNSPIATSDHTDGFWRRPVILPFTRRFAPGDPERVPDAAGRVLAAELPAIAAWALEGATRAQRQGGYTLPAGATATASEWREEACSVRSYLASRREDDVRCEAELFYSRYREWARENGYHPVNVKNFARRVLATERWKRDRSASGRFYERVPVS